MSGHLAAFCAVRCLRVSTARRRQSAWSPVLLSSVSATESPRRQDFPLQNCQSGPTWWPASVSVGRMASGARLWENIELSCRVWRMVHLVGLAG